MTYKIESIRHDHVQYGLTLEEAAKFLRLSEKTTQNKAMYHEPVRGAWYVIPEKPSEPIQLPKERLIKTGFAEDEWTAFCKDWTKACWRLARFTKHGVKWLRGVSV